MGPRLIHFAPALFPPLPLQGECLLCPVFFTFLLLQFFVLPFQHLKLLMCLSLTLEKSRKRFCQANTPCTSHSIILLPFQSNIMKCLSMLSALLSLLFLHFPTSVPYGASQGTVGAFPMLIKFVPLVALTLSATHFFLKHLFSLASRPSVFLLVLFPLLICFPLKLLSFACFSDIGPSNIGILQRHSTSSPQVVSLTLLASMISPSEFSQTYVQSPIEVLQGSAPGCLSALHPKMLRLLSSLAEF